MAKVGQISPEVLATMTSDGSKELWLLRRRHILPRVLETRYLNLRIHIWHPISSVVQFNQIAIAAMNEINRTSGRMLDRAVPSQRTDRSSNSSQQKSRAIVPAGSTRGETALRSRVVDIRKNLAVRNFFLQVAAEHRRACLT